MLYHVTLLKNINKIMANGILPNKPQLWVKRVSRFEKGFIYACSNYSDAVRWAFKTDWYINEANRATGSKKLPVAIVCFKDNMKIWEKDTHFEGAFIDGIWIKSNIGVLPENICSIILPAQWITDIKII